MEIFPGSQEDEGNIKMHVGYYNSSLIILFILLAFLIVSCGDQTHYTDLRDKMENNFNHFTKSFETKDLPETLSSFHPKGRIITSGKSLIEGESEIKEYFTNLFQRQTYRCDYKIDTCFISDQFGILEAEMTGICEDMEAGMTYPVERHVSCTFVMGDSEEMWIYQCQFIELE